MRLPFEESQFLDVFADYNGTLWPGVILLWMASVAICATWLARRSDCSRRLVGLLIVQWVWAGIAYHIWRFSKINPAAYLFGALFIVEALALAWFGVYRRRLRFDLSSSRWKSVAVAFVLYSLAYPFVTLAVGFRYPRMATFGVPCPTALLTAGLLLATSPPAPRIVLLIPLLWCIIGGSAAFLLHVHTDWPLLAGGLLLLVHASVAPRRISSKGDGEDARSLAD